MLVWCPTDGVVLSSQRSPSSASMSSLPGGSWATQLSLWRTALDHLCMRWSEWQNCSRRNLRQGKGIPWREVSFITTPGKSAYYYPLRLMSIMLTLGKRGTAGLAYRTHRKPSSSADFAVSSLDKTCTITNPLHWFLLFYSFHLFIVYDSFYNLHNLKDNYFK